MPKRARTVHEMTAEAYERAIRERYVGTFRAPTYEVIGGPKTRWPGKLSQSPRQIDVGVVRADSRDELWLVADAKRHGKRLKVTDVEAFLGFLEDVGCKRGVLASLLGGSAPARRRAAVAGVELYVVPYDVALSWDWARVAAGLWPWDTAFHSDLAHGLALLNRGRIDEFIEAIEGIHFEEWQALMTRAPSGVKQSIEDALRVIAEEHFDDGWRFNAVQLLSGSVARAWLEELRKRESDPENLEQIESLIAETRA